MEVSIGVERVVCVVHALTASADSKPASVDALVSAAALFEHVEPVGPAEHAVFVAG